MTLPAAFEAAIADWLARQSGGSHRLGTGRLTATYRGGGGSRRIDLAAYLVARLPATYAAVARVLAELQGRRPDFVPGSLLDAGSGPGTASWAAAALWPEIGRVAFLDNSPAFLKLAGELGAEGPPPLARARQIAGSIEDMPKGLAADLVIAAYALAELPLARVGQVAAGLWNAARSVLVLVEPGTPQGFARLRGARDTLLKLGGVPVAPCPHAAACPMLGADWCHFSVRLSRSRAHMHAKGANVPFEDEKFAYLVLARDGEPSGGGRILGPPAQSKPGITFRLCTASGLESRHVARRDAEAYKRARKLGWGDHVIPQIKDAT